MWRPAHNNMHLCQSCVRLISHGIKSQKLRTNILDDLPRRFLRRGRGGNTTLSLSHDEGEKKANNPLFAANKFVKDPIFKDTEIIFNPSEDEVREAEHLFENGRKHRVEFVKGAYLPDRAPQYALPEIAMIGRSNVGKSSLIKALFSKVYGLTVRTSQTPGHTKLLLFYQAGSSFSLVDLPGYGVRQPENFAVTAEGYLRTRKNLQMAFLLIDIEDGFQPMDFTAIQMLEDFSRPYSVVITKSDRASPRQLVTSLMAIRDVIRTRTNTCLPQPFIVSATKMRGISFLRSFIANITNKVKVSSDR